MSDELHPNRITDAEAFLRFVKGGNAYFTLRSAVTGVRYSYRAAKPIDERRPAILNEGPPPTFVSVLTGPDNQADYAYHGMLVEDPYFGLKVVTTRKSRVSAEAPSAKALAWALGWANRGKVKEDLEIWHEGRCAACARPLTDPQSIERGFGPICWDKGGY